MTKIKIISIIVILLLGSYFLYSIFIITKNRHHVEITNYRPYLWILNDSIKNEVDTIHFSGYIRKRDILYEYIIDNQYYISIWDFKDLKGISLNEITINPYVDLSYVDIVPREVLDAKENPEINIELGFSFNGSINLNIDNNSKIIKSIDTPNYKGFYGVVNKLSLSNVKGKHLILFDYTKENEPTVFLFYKSNKGFYMILINSKNIPFDESIINLLNLF